MAETCEYRYNYAAGFFTFFTFIYMGMCALGLALEAMITLLTPRFVPFFLVLLVRPFFIHSYFSGMLDGWLIDEPICVREYRSL